MKINRNNYEEYFLLYTDNELSAADRLAVEFFIRQNPDLQKEFTLLQQSTLSADDRITFRNKEVLMQVPLREGFIHHQNYQELFVLYSDDELTDKEKAGVEEFVYHHPQYQEEFELIQSIKLVPDLGLTFPDKKKLYPRQGTAVNRVIVKWSSIAAAAVLVIIAGILWLNKPGENVRKGIVKSDIKPALRLQAETFSPEIHITAPADSVSTPLAATQMIPEKRTLTHNRKNPTRRENLVANNQELPREERKIPDETATTSNTSPETSPRQPEKSTGIQAGNVDAAVATLPAHTTLSEPGTHNQPALTQSLVVNHAGKESQDIILAANDNTDNLTIAGFPVDKKGSIRGLFRKASRFIDKTTSIRPVKKQGLVIGNIEIAFQ